MTKLLLTELCPSRGHEILFENTARLLSKNFEVTCLTPSNSRVQPADRMPFEYYKANASRVDDIVSSIRYCREVACYVVDYAKKHQFDKVIVLTYNDVGLFFSHHLFPKNMTIYLMHHYNIDLYCSSKLRRSMFKTYQHKIKHIVQCMFMKDALVKRVGLPDSDIFVWPHPLNTIDVKSTMENIDCAGLSTSNDEDVVAELIELEKQTSVFKKNNLHVYIKSRQRSFDDGNLIIVKGFLDKEVFDDINGRAKSLFMPFPLSFQNRMSGTLMDALSNNKFIIGTDIPVILHSHKRYPSLVRRYNLQTFVEELKILHKDDATMKEFADFARNHSDDFLAEIMKDSIIGVTHSTTIDF